jgi:hypothetical protein
MPSLRCQTTNCSSKPTGWGNYPKHCEDCGAKLSTRAMVRFAAQLEGHEAPEKEYRVVWKREGLDSKRRRFRSRASAERLILKLGPEPWKAWGIEEGAPCPLHRYADDCPGTIGECCAAYANGLPPVEYVRLQVREVTPWSSVAEGGDL